MKFLTDFGDSAVLGPLSVIILIWLVSRRRSFGSALWWGGAVIACAATIAALKLFFIACPLPGGLESPSGHTAFSLLAYGALAVIVAAEQPVWWRKTAVLLAALVLVVGIAVSRIILQAHTPVEAIVGFAIGAAALAVFASGYRRTREARRPLALLTVAAVAALALFHGTEFTPEGDLHRLSFWLDIRGVACQDDPAPLSQNLHGTANPGPGSLKD